MQIFQTKWFAYWAHKEGLTAQVLFEAVQEISDGLVDANLGGHVVKKRVGLQGRGKSGGVRTLLAFKFADRAVFMYGFAKNQQSNISNKELKTLKLLAAQFLSYDKNQLGTATETKELFEMTLE